MTLLWRGILLFGVVTLSQGCAAEPSDVQVTGETIDGSCWIEEPVKWRSAPPELGYRSDDAAAAILLIADDGRCLLLDTTMIKTDEEMFIDKGSGLSAYLGVVDGDGADASVRLVRKSTTGKARMVDGNFLPPRFAPTLAISITDQRVVIGGHSFVRLPVGAEELRDSFAESSQRLTGLRAACANEADQRN